MQTTLLAIGVKWCLNSDCWLAAIDSANKQEALPKIFLSVICSAPLPLLQESLCGHPLLMPCRNI